MLMQILQGKKSQGISIGNIENEQIVFKKQLEGVQAHLKILNNQVAQLSSSSSRQQGTLPGKSEVNPREHLNAVELRSGKQLPEIGPPMSEKAPTPRLTREEKGKAVEESNSTTNTQEKEPAYIPPPANVPPIPFPSRLKKFNEESQFGKFAEMLKKMEITMPFHEAILQMPSYAKFLKDILTKKRVVEKETVALSTEISAAITRHELPPKMSDPGSFSIPCKLGNIEIDRARCDLGASVSLMPLSIYKKLNIGELKPTRMALQLADRSIKYPAGIVEDVPLKIGGFYVPVDFVVLDMDEDSKVPIILGRPILCTADAIVHVRAGRLTMKIGDETVEFTLDQNLRQPSTNDTMLRGCLGSNGRRSDGRVPRDRSVGNITNGNK
ncbi:PREDICTED: uncharacterized protein LOC104825822 [Tarenaya hassleriana]|uniref:uncharacterized protein LOC104825822 n=1 Tax=Tarenaya hassleriana TaxID=28532 RepID=UPI00053C65B1|nr:PREDICTED: uncharacterized protein LOC104825822 [Tarenaya hassleriana]